MVLGIAWSKLALNNAWKYSRYAMHLTRPRAIIISAVAAYGIIYCMRDTLAHLAYRRFQQISKKKTQIREEEMKEFATDEVFVTMDNQEIRLQEFKDEFVILIKSSNPEMLGKVNKIFSQLQSYQFSCFVVVNNFEDEQVINSEIASNGFFVTSTLRSTLVDDNIYLLYPEDEQLLFEQKIPDNVAGLAKQMRLRMNKKLDQKYKSSINFGITKESTEGR